jgi:hypothetical protein
MRMTDLNENLDGHVAAITHVAVRPDGERLATCSSAGTVIVWPAGSPCGTPSPARTSARWARRTRTPLTARIGGDRLIATGADGLVAVVRSGPLGDAVTRS